MMFMYKKKVSRIKVDVYKIWQCHDFSAIIIPIILYYIISFYSYCWKFNLGHFGGQRRIEVKMLFDGVVGTNWLW